MIVTAYAHADKGDAVRQYDSHPNTVFIGSVTLMLASPEQAERIAAACTTAAAAMRAAAAAEEVAA